MVWKVVILCSLSFGGILWSTLIPIRSCLRFRSVRRSINSTIPEAIWGFCSPKSTYVASTTEPPTALRICYMQTLPTAKGWRCSPPLYLNLRKLGLTAHIGDYSIPAYRSSIRSQCHFYQTQEADFSIPYTTFAIEGMHVSAEYVAESQPLF